MTMSAAIERQRKPLLRIIVTLWAMIGLVDGGVVERLPPSIYRAVLRILRPAEAAVRRLIVVAARSVVLTPPQRPRPVRKAVTPSVRKSRCRSSFRLFDPRARFSSAFAYERPRRRIFVKPVARPEPRIRVLDVGFDPRVPLFRNQAAIVPEPPPLPPPEDTVSAVRLCRRLLAIKSALEDLPRQARRYLRWQALPAGQRRPDFTSALRPGPPPGFRKNPIHKVDEILAECHWLARRPPQPDTS